jgi:hypothetical protein
MTSMGNWLKPQFGNIPMGNDFNGQFSARQFINAKICGKILFAVSFERRAMSENRH